MGIQQGDCVRCGQSGGQQERCIWVVARREGKIARAFGQGEIGAGLGWESAEGGVQALQLVVQRAVTQTGF
jgi:hypothetical protein